MKRSVTEEMELDNKNDGYHDEEKNEAYQTGAESHHEEIGLAVFVAVLDGHGVARRRSAGGVGHDRRRRSWVGNVEFGGGREIASWVFLETATLDRHESHRRG